MKLSVTKDNTNFRQMSKNSTAKITTEDKNTSSQKSQRGIKITMGAFLLAFLFLLVKPAWAETNEATQSPHSTPPKEEKAKTKALLPNQAIPVIDETSANEKEGTKDTNATKSKELYHVIVASLSTEKIAKRNIEEFMAAHPFDTFRIVVGSDRYRVSISENEELEKAEAYLKILKLSSDKFDDAWILKQ